MLESVNPAGKKAEVAAELGSISGPSHLRGLIFHVDYCMLLVSEDDPFSYKAYCLRFEEKTEKISA
jgi:hypothetical protein